MAVAKVFTRGLVGIDAPLITIEVHLSHGLPNFTLVGLPATGVRESRARVRSAILNSGYQFPPKKITLSLAPADLPKQGARYDLPIALAILIASGQITAPSLEQYEFLGELSLDGSLKAARGVIPAIVAAGDSQHQIIVPLENHQDFVLNFNDQVRFASNLAQVCHFLKGKETLPCKPAEAISQAEILYPDLDELIGQQHAKRALEIAAAGGHSLLLIGPPGTGKTMLATRLAGILPPLNDSEKCDIARLYSVAVAEYCLTRPFRAPHHSITLQGLIGGGYLPSLGEISLAHHGVLFLDELTEFDPKTLNALREPLESGHIVLSRVHNKLTYPACFQLIAAMNPTGSKPIKWTVRQPRQAVSLPLLDRFHLSVDLPLPSASRLQDQQSNGESSAQVRNRVVQARERQLCRQAVSNALLDNSAVEVFCQLSIEDAHWFEQACNQLTLSHRAWFNLLKVARTIADLQGDEKIAKRALQEALSYRAVDQWINHLSSS